MIKDALYRALDVEWAGALVALPRVLASRALHCVIAAPGLLASSFGNPQYCEMFPVHQVPPGPRGGMPSYVPLPLDRASDRLSRYFPSRTLLIDFGFSAQSKSARHPLAPWPQQNALCLISRQSDRH
jgi:hypothetical protein